MPEAQPSRPRLYTIPPSAPFLTSLARAVLAGDLPIPGGVAPDPLALPRATLYLPTRRAARALREAFLAAAGGRATLLPRIRALGDPDEDAALIFGTEAGAEHDFEGSAGVPAVGSLARRLALMRLVLAWSRTLRAEEIRDIYGFGPLVATPAQASYLAADLARLMDFIESEEVDLAALEGLMPDEYAEHWQLTLDFLDIVTEHWPQHLRDQGLVSPVARRNGLMAMEATRLQTHGSTGPVIAAGSTGTVPATARLLKTIASLPNGAVVLPGLDLSLDAASWKSLGEHPEHPQFALAQLLAMLGVEREEVAYVPGSAPDASMRARLALVSEVLRPAESTELWQRFLDADELRPDGRASFANALAGIRVVIAPTAHDEAEAIALILKSCIETPGRTAALVTPDRVLARRVAARLKRYDLAIDDSAGVPVSRTVPGAFLDLVLGAVESNFAPPELMALLKHPLALVGRQPGAARASARALERGAFRDIYVGQGLAGARAALEAARADGKRRRSSITEHEQAIALKLVEDLEAAFAPLTALFGEASQHQASRLADAHAEVAEALARDVNGASSGLWQGDAGEALSLLLAELIDARSSLTMEAADYHPFYRTLLAGEVVRPAASLHPRLFIWGPIEARLLQPDVVILGSLNEGVWPRPQEAGPWLSRPMREKLGLSPPEWRIGRAAHDFAQALGADTVYLTRALKVDGVPTVPSRWLQRLQALVKASGLEPEIEPEHPWVEWARERDKADAFRPALPPRPCPPVEARPRKMSVTRIEKWIANPYEIFARDILRLEKLKLLGAEPDQALRGQIVHKAMHDFAHAHPESLPADIYTRLIGIADRHFAELDGSPRVEAFWRPSFQRFARWFAATEPGRRVRAANTRTEVEGALDLAVASGFRLTARADRIDVGEDGSVVIYDYKTGRPPIQRHVEDLFAPQLPLEGAIAEGGGFAELGKCAVRDLRYIHASGRYDGGEERPAGSNAATLAGRALANLIKLVERFDQPDMPYEVKRRRAPAFVSAYKYDEYAHLARIQEWLTLEAEEDF
ncbi:MAG: double-strand break repair protein AddB [Methyloceanibacter sp.]